MPETPASQASGASPETRTNASVPVRRDARAKKLRDNLKRRKEAARNKASEGEGA